VTHEQAFLADILEHPDDDTPRLVYADWLDENAGAVACGSCAGSGNPVPHTGPVYRCLTCDGTGRLTDGRAARAEFIRVQCALARYDAMSFAGCPACGSPDEGRAHADDCPRGPGHPLRRRERALLDAHGLRWLEPPLMALESERASRACGWRRGFVEGVTCAAAGWLAHGDAVLVAQPVTRVTLTTVPQVEYRPGGAGGGVRYWLAGDPAPQTRYVLHWADWTLAPDGDPHPYLLTRLLSLRFPGLSFELPAVCAFCPARG
jgi:uncharacterized protein (TIGR02996 family)